MLTDFSIRNSILALLVIGLIVALVWVTVRNIVRGARVLARRLGDSKASPADRARQARPEGRNDP